MRVQLRIILLSLLIVTALLGGLFGRLYGFPSPSNQVREEGFFVDAARGYVNGEWVYQDHPPVGMLAMAFTMQGVGDTPLGWRLLALLSGLGSLAMLWLIASEIFKSRLAGWLAASFGALDGLFIVYGRIGCLDGLLTFTVLFGFWLMNRVKHPLAVIFGVGTALGLAAGLKMSGTFLLLPFFYYIWKRGWWKWVLPTVVWAFLLYWAVLVFSKIVTNLPNPFVDAWNWQQFTWAFHSHVWEDRGVPWYSWPLDYQPYYLFFEDTGSTIRSFLLLMNPLQVWISTLLLTVLGIIGIVRNFPNHKQLRARTDAFFIHALPLLIAYIAFYLPWVIYIKRLTLIYCYFIPYAFSILILAGALSHAWKKRSWVVIGVMIVIVASGLFFLPLWSGYPLSPAEYDARMWFSSWKNLLW